MAFVLKVVKGGGGGGGGGASSALLEESGVGVIFHGEDASKARGTAFASYIWRGSVEPEHMTEADDWVETP